MRLLLDTHVWLWSRLDPDLLSQHAQDLLRDCENELWLSPVSVWELMALIEKGRVVVDEAPRDWVTRALRTVPLQECPLTHEVALHSRAVSLPHQDPVDRFLVASAIVYELSLLTADRRLLGAKGVSTVRAD
jgi:PIN domain nuclease of toxin-antitoxin system